MIKKQFKIAASTGFARAACLLVSDAVEFKSEIFLTYRGKAVSLKNPPDSMIELLALKIRPGTYVGLIAMGSDECDALQRIEKTLREHLLIGNEGKWQEAVRCVDRN
ncbi:HPr family phosphocarrier protein [Peribacillus sp. SCS-26]|uniref:HPr family phosphocarrier protein n=1 Tax=Paraperibacillus marinus TaxID=3115295 RepID=UPI0039065654